MNKPMMSCGHTANGKKYLKGTQDKIPCCVICSCDELATEKPDLKGRLAVCMYGNAKGSKCQPVPSKVTLPFFRHEPTKEVDSFFCGCRGFD
jgi:hypothetical protein